MPKSPRVENDFRSERERLASDLHRLEEALSNARDNSAGEEEGSLVARLREATRKRVRIEEEFERSSERWRDERRTLNAEIDRLDRALQKAQSDARRGRGPAGTDPKLAAQVREAAEQREQAERLLDDERRTRTEERERLEARVAELEARLVDTLERANNMSHGDSTRSAALEAALEAQREKIAGELRAEFEAPLEESRTAIAQLEEERGRLHLEIHRLKETARTPASGRSAGEQSAKSRLSLRDRLKGLQRGSPQAESGSADTTALEDRIDALGADLDRERKAAAEAAGRAEAAEARSGELEAEKAGLESQLLEARQVAASADPDLALQLEASEQARTELEARIRAMEARQVADAAPDPETAGRIRMLEASLEKAQADLAQAAEAMTAAEIAHADLTARLEAAGEAVHKQAAETEAAAASWRERQQGFEKRIGELESELKAGAEARAASEADAAAWQAEREQLGRRIADLEQALGEASKERADLESRYQETETAFDEARKRGNALQSQVEAGSAAWERERAELTEEVESLQASLRAARESDASADKTARQLVADLEASEKKLADGTRAWAREKQEFEARLRAAEEKLQEGLGQAESEREQLEAAMAALGTERDQAREEAATGANREQDLSTRLAELEQALAENQNAVVRSSEEASRVAAELETMRQERDALAAAKATWEEERESLEARVSELGRELEKQAETGRKSRRRGSGESAASRGIASFGRVLSSLGGGPGDASPGSSVADLEARRQALEVRLMESEDSRNELASKLQAANEEWEKQRRQLEQQLEETQSQTGPGGEQADVEARQNELLEKLQRAEERYTALEKASMASARAWDQQRSELEGEISQWEQQVTAEAERKAEETRKALAEQYEKQLLELRSQKEELEAQFAAQSGGGGGAVDPEVIAREMARVDAEVDEINRLIEDPNAALSNVMRKNAERSELQAYRRGLSYLAERVSQDPKE